MKTKRIMLIVCCISAFCVVSAQSVTTATATATTTTITDSSDRKAEAISLINMPEPTFQPITPQPVDPRMLEDMALDQPNTFEPVYFEMDDGIRIYTAKYKHPSNTKVILLHGVMGSSYNFNRMAGLLRKALDAEIWAMDFRGHGNSEGIPGDVPENDQYAKDLKQVIEAIRAGNPGSRIIVAAHSMGGGIALRQQMLTDHARVEGYLLFAPHLGHDAPTLLNAQPTESGQEGQIQEKPIEEPFLKIHIERLIGISLLNKLGIHDYDSLPVLFFNVPEDTPLRRYTFRSNYSMAPQEYKKALNALDVPTLIIAGSEDEAFSSRYYRPAVQGYDLIEVLIVEGASHNGIRQHPTAIKAAGEWAQKNMIIE